MTVDELRAHIERWDQASWCLAALAIALRNPQHRPAAEVLDAVGLTDPRGVAGPLADPLAGQAGAPLLQIARLLAGDAASWADQPDEALLAQGAASAQAAPMFAQFVLPGLPGLAERLRDGGWVMVAHAKFSSDPLENALNRFKTAAFGGTAVDDAQARALLESCGFTDVRSFPTPPYAPALTLARPG